MLWLLAPAAFAVIWALYSISPAKKAARLVGEAAKTVEALQSEVDACRSKCRAELSAAVASRRDDIQLSRLEAISIEELKKHATGLRLQPLRDAGVRSIADLQPWSQGRLEGLRGVGPKSAAQIPGIVQRISSSVKSQPIADPEPPFHRDKERTLVLAIYRELQCERLLDRVPFDFHKLRSDTDEIREQVSSKTRFFRWMWTFGRSEDIRSAIAAAQATSRSYEKGNEADKVCAQVRGLLSECNTVRSNRVETSKLTDEYNQHWADYDAALGRSVGTNGRVRRFPPPWVPSRSEQIPTNTNVGSALRQEGASALEITKASTVALDESKQQAREQLQKYIDSVAPAKFDQTKLAADQGLTSFSVGTLGTLSGFAIPTRPMGRAKKTERWILPNESVVVQGVTLARGMVFVSEETGEPALGVIYPSLEVRAGEYPPGSTEMYWQGYAGLSPVQRYHYVHWLADGARSKDFSQFAVFYFHGLERRLVQIAKTKNASAWDERDVLNEVKRITSDFSEFNIPLSHYANRLLAFCELRSLPPNAPVELDSPIHRSYELPWRLVYDLGRLAADRRPVPPALALRWLKLEPNYYPRTPVTRCPEQFNSLFLSLYVQKFDQGMTLPARGKTLTFQYEPSNYFLRSKDLELTFKSLPDAREWANIRSELSVLANEATAKIDAYSRFCGRSPEKANSIKACLLLPSEIWPEAARRTLEELQGLAKGFASMEWSQFLGLLGTSEPLPAGQLLEMMRGLQAMGLGIEPDLLEGSRRPKAGEVCTLFPVTVAEEPVRTDAAYRNASLAVSLMACVAAADGHASDTEQATAVSIITSWKHLHPDHQSRLQATYRHQARQPARLSNLKTRMLAMPQDDRTELLGILAQMVTSDDVVSPAEVKFLEQVYTMLGVDQGQLYTALHKGNVSVRQEPHRSGVFSQPGSSTNGFSLDLGRIERLVAESEQVSQILAEVFQEEESGAAAAVVSEPEQVTSVAEPGDGDAPLNWPGLGKAETEYLTLLLTRTEWTRQELSSAAAARKLMLDGTLEVINDSSFEVLGEALLDGHDPIYVQTKLLENA